MDKMTALSSHPCALAFLFTDSHLVNVKGHKGFERERFKNIKDPNLIL